MPTTAQLAQRSVATLLAHFATALPWLTDVYGLVQTGTDKTGKNLYPQLYAPNVDGQTTDIRPDGAMAALCFFERDGPSRIDWADDLNTAGDWEHPLAAVLWLNLPLLDATRTDDFTEEVVQDFLQYGLRASPIGAYITPERVELQQERVWQRYRWAEAEQQYSMYPYASIRLPFTVRQRYEPCPARFVARVAPSPKMD